MKCTTVSSSWLVLYKQFPKIEHYLLHFVAAVVVVVDSKPLAVLPIQLVRQVEPTLKFSKQ